MLVIKAPLRDYDGSIIGTIGSSTDITEIKHMEERLKKSKEKLELSDKLKTQFIMNMEHDFRTPFSGIWGLADMLQREETDSTKKEYLGYILDCTQELMDYFTEILDYSKLQRGWLSVQDKKFNVRNLVERIVKVENPAIKNKKLNMIMHVDQDIPSILRGDDHRLFQILINLVSNAIKFTHEG